MKHILTFTGSYWAAVLVVVIGLGAYGCGDSVSVSDDVEVPLSSLTVTPGTLQPAFSSNTTNYTVNAPTSADKVTVTARPKDSTTTMEINGIPTAAGQGQSVPLGSPGTITTISIALTSQTGTESTYTVNVTRLLSSNNNLSTLDVTPGDLNPPFDPNTENYTVDVVVLNQQVSVTAKLQDTGASMTINGQATRSGEARTIDIGPPGSNTRVDIIVRASNGSTKTYRITVNHLSGDNNLSALSVTPPGTLPPPGFVPSTLNYTVDVASDVDKVTISATKSDVNASMSGRLTAGPGIATDTETLPLGGEGTSTDFLITVAAPDPNVPPKDYTITVKRATPAAPLAPTVAPDLISEDDSCTRDLFNNCIPSTDEDNITNVTTPRFRIPPPAVGETSSLYVDGNKVDAIFDPVANTLVPTAALIFGSHPITYTVANAGGESAQSPPLIVFISPL